MACCRIENNNVIKIKNKMTGHKLLNVLTGSGKRDSH